MSDSPAIAFDLSDGVARLTLNRPDMANALDMEAGRQLVEATQECRENADVRAVLITGNGRFFSAGGDLGSMAAAEGDIEQLLLDLANTCHTAYRNLLNARAPVIAAVNGPAAGVGLGLTLISDLTLASENASFVMAYTAAGLTPDGGASLFLPMAVGFKRAKEMALTNRKLSAEEAEQWGIVNRVVSADELMPEAEKLAAKLAAGPTGAYGRVKQLMLQAITAGADEILDAEANTISASAGTADGQEGINAFLNKRKPEFSGA